MARPFLFTIAVAQISVNPAYSDELIAALQEPVFRGDDDKVGLFSVAGIESINILRQRIAEQYIAHLNRKLESVIRFSASHGTELLVLPEYSVPAESLPLCRGLADELGIAIIAGSHIVTLSHSAQSAYKQVGLVSIDPGKPGTLDDKVRHSVCIAFVPGQATHAFSKYVKSKWETCIVSGEPAFHSVVMESRSGKLEVQALICIEALAETPASKEKHTLPRLVVIPAFTPSTTPFHNEGNRLLRQGKCTAFVNVADLGGSCVFVRAERAPFWFTEAGGTVAIPKGAEAVLIIEADLEKQFEIRKSIAEHAAVTDVRLYPLVYPTASAASQEYVDLVQNTAITASEQLQEKLGMFATLSPKSFPPLLQEKLQHFLFHVLPSGTISSDELTHWIEPVVVSDTPSTNALRWELCNQAIETVNALLLSGKYMGKNKELIDVLQHLLEKRNSLAGVIEPPADSKPIGSKEATPVQQKSSTESPFFDREQVFDRIRAFINQQQTSAFVLAGMRGIGKTTLVSEAFRQAIPPRKKIWLQLTEGVSYERMLAQLAYACNLRLPADLDVSSPEQRSSLEASVKAFLSQGSGAVVVIDDFQYLLSGGDVDNPLLRSFLLSLLGSPDRNKSKFILISNVATKFSPEIESYCSTYTLRGLRDEDAVRLLQYWYQFRTGDMNGVLPLPSGPVLNRLGGHPLAVKVAARLFAERPTTEVLEDLSIFKELRDTIVSFILEQLPLSEAESELLSFASVLRLPVPREAFVRWKGDSANLLLNSLTSQYLVETSERGYELHPLVRDFYYSALSSKQTMEYHHHAARLYLDWFEKSKKFDGTLVPEYLGEAVHHFLAAGEKQRVQGLAFYRQELKPVAVTHYRKGDFKLALKEYRVLVELDDRDPDAHLHLALIYARERKWGDAELHFGRAIELRPKAAWILQAYGAAKLRANKLAEAEQLLTEAEEANPYHAPTLVEMGRLYERKGDPASAESYYRGAIQLDPENSFAYFQLANLLYHENQIPDALEMAQAALSTRPTDERNRQLVKELREKMAKAASGN